MNLYSATQSTTPIRDAPSVRNHEENKAVSLSNKRIKGGPLAEQASHGRKLVPRRGHNKNKSKVLLICGTKSSFWSSNCKGRSEVAEVDEAGNEVTTGLYPSFPLETFKWLTRYKNNHLKSAAL